LGEGKVYSSDPIVNSSPDDQLRGKMIYNNLDFEDDIYLIGIGDLHIGDKQFTKKSRIILQRVIDFIKEHDNAYFFFNGDVLNTATRDSKTTPFGDAVPEEELITINFLFWDIRDRCLGAVDGNHEMRVKNYANFSPTLLLCNNLGIQYYRTTAVLDLKVGGVNYMAVFQHTTGGGKLIGSKINRGMELKRSTIPNADLFYFSHNHLQAVVPVQFPYYEDGELKFKNQMLIDCGSFLEWNDGYAEIMQLESTVMGCPIVKLSSKIRQIEAKIIV
jgi:hypothetical protein